LLFTSDSCAAGGEATALKAAIAGVGWPETGSTGVLVLSICGGRAAGNDATLGTVFGPCFLEAGATEAPAPSTSRASAAEGEPALLNIRGALGSANLLEDEGRFAAADWRMSPPLFKIVGGGVGPTGAGCSTPCRALGGTKVHARIITGAKMASRKLFDGKAVLRSTGGRITMSA
jgi:hypothetical protein